MLASFQREKDVAISSSPNLRANNVTYPVNFALLSCVRRIWMYWLPTLAGAWANIGKLMSG